MHRAMLLLTLPLAACLPGGGEGTSPGECFDGLDNDLDGYFDCNDLDCFSHTDCTGGGPLVGGTGGTTGTGGTGGTTGTDNTGAGSPIAAHLTTFRISYTMALDFTGDLASVMCDGYGICDCVNRYGGTGTQVLAFENSVTFEGEFSQSSTDCSEEGGLGGIIWTPSTGSSFHTVRFDSDLTELKEWVAHGVQSATDPVNEPSSNSQYWITAMDEPYDDNVKALTHEEDESTTIDGLIPLTIFHELEFTFNE